MKLNLSLPFSNLLLNTFNQKGTKYCDIVPFCLSVIFYNKKENKYYHKFGVRYSGKVKLLSFLSFGSVVIFPTSTR